MQKLKIDPALFDLFPDAQLGVLVLDGLDNHVKKERISHY